MDWMSPRSAGCCAHTPIKSSPLSIKRILGRQRPHQNSRLRQVGAVHRTAKAIEVNRPYLVKINFAPAIIRTIASRREIVRTGKWRLPRREPKMPPTIAAALTTTHSDRMEGTDVT